MKKTILFMLINMNVGGTEKALLNMLAAMPGDRLNIKLLLLERSGGFLQEVPKGVQVETIEGFPSMKPLLNGPPRSVAMELLRRGKPIDFFLFAWFQIVCKLVGDKSLYYKYLLSKHPEIDGVDLAVAYAGPMDFISYFVAHKVKAKKKIQWIHFDITKIGFHRRFASKTYGFFDRIFVVSKEAKEKLAAALPEHEHKTSVFLNLVSPDAVRKQAKKGVGFTDRYDGIRILTVGRLSNEKGQDMAAAALKRLVDDGYDVRWYCVGEGRFRETCERIAADRGLADRFVLLGQDPNPYPYMEQCDIYVQPSRYEGYCLTVVEAKCFHKPIVTTAVNGANEQIKHGETGLIVDIHEDALYRALKTMIDQPATRELFARNLQREAYDAAREADKLLNVM